MSACTRKFSSILNGVIFFSIYWEQALFRGAKVSRQAEGGEGKNSYDIIV